MDLATMLINPYVGVYLLIVVSVLLLTPCIGRGRKRRIAGRRRARGLPDGVLMNHEERLLEQRRESVMASVVLLATLVITPFLIVIVARHLIVDEEARVAAENGLALVFVTLLVWLLLSGTDLLKSILGGLAFKTMSAFERPFQIGDRVTMKGVSGKVINCGVFYTKLQTVDDDLVSIPSSSLWGEVLVSANAGERSSLCVMHFYLSPSIKKGERQSAEDTIWEAIQSSSFYEPSRPLQIYTRQNPDSIQLTAKAYVALTYDEALFVNDVQQAFLDWAAEQELPLAQP